MWFILVGLKQKGSLKETLNNFLHLKQIVVIAVMFKLIANIIVLLLYLQRI